MGLFDIFGNKTKKNTDINNANKAQILALLQQAQMGCKDADSLGILRNIQTQLQGQGESSKEELQAIDGEIIALINDAYTYILKQQYPTAKTKLNKALNKAIDRTQYCMAGGQMTREDRKRAEAAERARAKITANTPKSRMEELQSQVDDKNAELDALNTEFEQLRALYAANPTNASIIAQANTVKAKIAATKNIINTLTIEISKEVQDESIATIAEQNDTIVSSRTHSETEMELARAKLQTQNAEREALTEQLAADADLLNQGTAGLFANPFADESSAAASILNPFGDAVATGASAGMATGQKTQAQYGGFAASEVGSANMANDIRKATQAIQSSIDMFNDKVEDANEDLADYNAELRPLLARRKTASPSDCLAIDTQIDQINAKRNSVIYKIKRFNQQIAQLNDKLALLDKLSAQQDLASTNAKIEQLTGGKFADFAGLAMFLNDSVKESNEQLEEIGAAVAVSESEEIMMNSASGASAALADASGLTKDEHKYDNLEREVSYTPAQMQI